MATAAASAVGIDEYTDYSCSTSIERLARDVETLLRSWHVSGGSDRHVSMSSQAPLLTLIQATNSKSTSTAYCSVHMIRSDQLVWTLQYHLQDGRRMSCQMDLELALWDGPARDKDNAASSSNLAFSLRRPKAVSDNMPLTDLFADFSSLFGIGQHISLTPVNTELPIEVQEHLSVNILTRHDAKTTAVPVLASVLSGWLQTSLNIAATCSHCCLPVFGVWGHYQPPQQQQSRLQNRSGQNDSQVPPWAQASQKLAVSQQQSPRFRRRRRQTAVPTNTQYVPPLITGQLFSDDATASFLCSVMPASSKNNNNSSDRDDGAQSPEPRLSSWGSLLLQHSHDNAVALWGARHVFAWSKPRRKSRGMFDLSLGESDQQEWRRKPTQQSSKAVDLTLEKRTYRLDCRRFALFLLEKASGASTDDPLWGPTEDPVASIHATVTWSGHADEHDKVQPLLALPLKSRSRNMSTSDRDEMEDAIERMVLDPSRPTTFVVQTRYDQEVAQASLATTQRCVLAALIRTTTLPPETLLSYLVDESVVGRWDGEAGNVIASTLADQVHASMATHSIVAAMDWTHAAEDMIEQWQADEIVDRVLDGGASLGFPNAPEDVLATESDSLFLPFQAAAPAGRLLSLLFMEMTRVRSPSSMALVWNVFVAELRRRWESQESLPNMKHVPGLDAPQDAVHAKRCFSSCRSQASLSAMLETEPDPDDFHCLIGQKLQVFNLCLESVVISEIQGEHAEKRFRLNDIEDESNHDEQQHSQQSSAAGVGSNGEPDEFFDAQEESTLRSAPISFLPPNLTPGQPATGTREGARCPVHGLSLVASGDQLYAPYLQRSYPLTDDVVAERRLMLAQQEGSQACAVVQQRLEIAHRFLKPKLLSDMSAFKAANPGSAFRDFVKWYGNPVDPLQEYEEQQTTQDIHLGLATSKPVISMLDRAGEAIRVLNETRDLWARAWDEAKPIPAFRQVPLFDATNVTGMALDYLETMHPGSLLCQVTAVNLSMAFFALVASADDTVEVDTVRSALESLRDKVDSALRLLSLDATAGIAGIGATLKADRSTTLPSFVVSVDAIASCERACTALSRAEILVARATSLLHKLPNQYDLVDSIMKNADAAPVKLSTGENRDAVLRTIQLQQELSSKLKSPELKPRPMISDYIFRNMDDMNPSQLCIRHKDKGSDASMEDTASLFVALTKYSKH